MAKVKKRTWKDSKGRQSFCWVVDYNEINGQRIRKGGFATKIEAEKYLANALSNISKGLGSSQDKTISFDRAANEYISYHTEIYCKPSTINTYKRYLNVHLKPFFGGIKLVDISVQKIQEFMRHQLNSTNLSNNSINKNIVLLGSIVQKQVDEGALFVNPVYKVKKLPVETKEMRALNKEEVQKLLKICMENDPDFYPALLTAIMTGVRRGELLALTWDKIDWQKKQIFISKSLYEGKLVEPKTKASTRKVNMPDEVFKVLKELRTYSRSGAKGFVFCNSNGNAQEPRNLIRRHFEPILKKAEIMDLRWHDLRHTYASLLISQNVPTKYIQSQMGHSSIRMTMDRYGHLLPEVHEQGVQALNELLSLS